jgi:hypothetical protein
MSRSKEHSGKPEVRWDSVGNRAWRNDKQVIFTEHHQKELLEICNDPDFFTAVNSVTCRYVGREKPQAPLRDIEPRFQKDYKKRHIQPTPADIKKTLLNLQKEDSNRLKQLNEISRCHPIWGVIKRSWYEEHKTQIDRGNFDRIHEVADFQYMLETTPKDHPQWQALQGIWNKNHQADFEYLNNVFIPMLIKISLDHIDQHPKKVYLTETSGSKNHKIWLAWHLGIVLKRFGIKVSCTKDGPLAECLRIVLDAAGHPIETTHKYITSAVLKELKKPRP